MKQWWNEWYNKYAVLSVMVMVWHLCRTQINWAGIDGQTWAAWVQAVGAVVAIGGAFFIANLQNITVKRARLEQELVRLQTIYAVTIRAETFCVDLWKAWASGNMDSITGYDLTMLTTSADRIDGFPFFEIPSATIVIRLEGIPLRLRQLEAELRQAAIEADEQTPIEFPAAKRVPSKLQSLLQMFSVLSMEMEAQLEARR